MSGGQGEQGVPTRAAPPATMAQRLSEIDTSVAHAARIYDYLLGGTNNFAVDRAAVEAATAGTPGGLEVARANARANRAFLGRAVRFLAAEVGIRQFLDIGTGIPTAANVHDVAQAVHPAARVVYVDNDPMVLAQAHALLDSTAEGATDFVQGDLRDPAAVVRAASATLDMSRPTAIVLAAVLHLVPDEADPRGIVRRLVDAVPPGSYLALSHSVLDEDPDARARIARRLTELSLEHFAWRTRAQIVPFFDGLDVVEPGVVPVNRWRPDRGEAEPADRDIPILGGVARIPPAY